jgi:thymidine phosphorylase
MDQPLGRMVGNSLEVIEAIDCLRGEGPDDLMEVTYGLCAEMLLLGGVDHQRETALKKARSAIADGAALEAFRKLVEAQGGDSKVADDYERLPLCEQCCEYGSELKTPSYVAGLNARHIGEVACLLGAGRSSADATVDPAVGLELLKKVGERVEPGEAIIRIHYQDTDSLEEAEERLRGAIELSEHKPKTPPLIVDRIVASSLASAGTPEDKRR